MSDVSEVIAKAYSMLGVRYVLGAESETAVDCSGLVYRCFLDTGHVDLIGGTRRLAAGYAHYFANRNAYSNDINDAQVGDLICYTHGSDHISHIAIYVGNYRVISALTTTGVTETRYDRISVDFDGVCLVPFVGARTASGLPGGNDSDGESGADPTDSDFNDEVMQDNADTQAGLGMIETANTDWVLPVRKVRITFPTPTDARFDYTLSESYDQAFSIADPYPGSDDPGTPGDPPLGTWLTETIPGPVTAPPYGTGEAGPTYYEVGAGFSEVWYVRTGPTIPDVIWTQPNPGGYVETGGTHGGNDADTAVLNEIYSTVGVSDGFMSAIPFYATTCTGLDYGGFHGGETREQWYLINPPTIEDSVDGIPPTAFSYELTWDETSTSGAANGVIIRVCSADKDWRPDANSGFSND